MTVRLGRARIAALSVGVASGALVVVFALRTHTAPSTTTLLGGRQAPVLSGADLTSGRELSMIALRGRFVFVDFFASWCGTCLSEEPQIEAFTFAHRNDPTVAFIGVDIEDSTNNARSFFVHYGATWPAIVDTTGSIAQSYGVAQPPELFLVDPHGKIVSSISQAVTSTELDGLLHEAKVARA